MAKTFRSHFYLNCFTILILSQLMYIFVYIFVFGFSEPMMKTTYANKNLLDMTPKCIYALKVTCAKRILKNNYLTRHIC